MIRAKFRSPGEVKIMRQGRLIPIAALVGLILAGPCLAAFSAEQRATTEELAKQAQLILAGGVQRVESRWEDGIIYTYVSVTVHRMIKGPSDQPTQPQRVTIRHVGGEVENVGLRQSDTPHFLPGEEVLVFLEADVTALGANSAIYRVVGGYQGKYSLTAQDSFGALGEGSDSLGKLTKLLGGGALPWRPEYEVIRTSTGKALHWPESAIPVPYFIDSAGTPDTTGEFAAIHAAYAAWNSVPSSHMQFTYAGSSSAPWGRGDGVNIHTWIMENWEARTGTSSRTIAVNRFWYYPSSGEIFDSDIAYNGEHFHWSAAGEAERMDVQNIATHEIGHSLSLDDLYGAEDAEKTMFGYADLGETKKRTLEQDDIDGISYLYPARSPNPDTIPPRGSIVINNGALSTNSLIVTLNLEASDAGGSGLSQMRFSNDGATWSEWESYAETREGWDLSTYGGNKARGTKRAYVQFKDGAGNQSHSYSDSISYYPSPALPEAPSNLSLSSSLFNRRLRITLRWVDNADNEAGFRIERRQDGGGYREIARVRKNKTSYTDRDRLSAGDYCYRVRAYNSAGVSAYAEGCISISESTVLFRSAELVVEAVVIEPNPIRAGETAELSVKGQGIQGVRLEVFDLAGRLVFACEAADSASGMKLNGLRPEALATGVYLYAVSIRGQGGELVRTGLRKLVILR
jgi:hypothetical protein